MHVIFFGAGASYGSDEMNTPPLGPNLFNALALWSPKGWGALPDPWPARFAANFEDAMAALIAAGIFAAPLQWSMAAYFFKCFPISATNLYIRLLSDLGRTEKNIALITLNYDRLLCLAAAQAGVRLTIGGSRREGAQFPLCLPHGCSVLKCVSVGATRGVSFTGNVATSGAIEVMHDARAFDQERETNVFPPVMSYFEPNKFTVSGANFIENHRQQFGTLVRGASRVAIVGVNVHAADKHIWAPLAKAPGTCFYLAGAAGAEKYRAWCKGAGRRGDTVCEKYFANGYDELLGFIGR